MSADLTAAVFHPSVFKHSSLQIYEKNDDLKWILTVWTEADNECLFNRQ